MGVFWGTLHRESALVGRLELRQAQVGDSQGASHRGQPGGAAGFEANGIQEVLELSALGVPSKLPKVQVVWAWSVPGCSEPLTLVQKLEL